MKKTAFIIALVFTLLLATSALSGCSDGGGLTYPDYPQASADTDSWEQWRSYDDSVIEIDWFVDDTVWTFTMESSSLVADRILEKTGVRINFIRQNSQGTQLNSLLSSGQLPDMVTLGVADLVTRVELERSERAYPLDELIRRWAPTLDARIDEQIRSYYAGYDGRLYGVPSYCYTDTLLSEMEAQGINLNANGAIVARKDYLETYFAETGLDPNRAYTASDVLEMCRWVKNRFGLGNDNPTFCLSAFDNETDYGSRGIRWLMEYFNVQPEDAEGNLTFKQTSDNARELYLWLNTLYREHIISSGNLSADAASIGAYLQRGLPFIFAGSPQDYAQYLKQWALSSPEAEYVPILFTNDKGEVPQLSDLSGMGLNFTMITSGCERPDRVIKLLDFLYSEEGQHLVYYGVEGESWNYSVQPGETKRVEVNEIRPDGSVVATEKDVTFQHGLISFTDSYWNDIQSGNSAQYRMLSNMSLVYNPVYTRLTQEDNNGDLLSRYIEYISHNCKSALIPFTYRSTGMMYQMDPTDPDYLTMVTRNTNIVRLWQRAYVSMISAPTAEACLAEFEQTVAYSERNNYEELLAFQNEAFLRFKQSRGITFAYPPNDPESDYSSLYVNSIYGRTELRLAIPDKIARI